MTSTLAVLNRRVDEKNATFERRALAVEWERAIAENELQSQIELARREEQLVAQRGANARLQAQEAAGADQIDAEAQAAREQPLAGARADGTRALGEAKAARPALRPGGRIDRRLSRHRRHGTRGQAAFFLSTRGRSIDDADGRHQAIKTAIAAVSAAIPADWRRAMVERSDLPRWSFAPGDIVVVVGQDGLVANLARYSRRSAGDRD